MAAVTHDLARAHRYPVPLPPGVDFDRNDTVLVRYDGELSKGGDTVVLAVVAVEDLAKMPPQVMSGLDLLVERQDGTYQGSEHAFFRRTQAGVALYVDTDTHPHFIDRILRASQEQGLVVLNAVGDLDHMVDPQGDIRPQRLAAWRADRFEPVPVRGALDMIVEKRRELRAGRLTSRAEPTGSDMDPSP